MNRGKRETEEESVGRRRRVRRADEWRMLDLHCFEKDCNKQGLDDARAELWNIV